MSRSEERMRELVAEQALEWFLAHRSGALSEARRQEFIEWLRASPAHAREYLALTGFVNDFAQAAKGVETPAEALVAEACAEPDTVQPLYPASASSAAAPLPKRPRMLAALGLAAATAVIIVLSAWWQHDRTTYATAHAEQRSWRMPDGSTVHLNSSSKLKVKFEGTRREVELLRGQALFQVAKDPSRPFRVRAGETVVQAVGTEFDVYRQPRRTLISVVEGRVVVWRLPPDSTNLMSRVIEPRGGEARSEPIATLDAGEQARISRGSALISKRPASVHKTVAWLQRQVIFDHDPLGRAVEEFNRYADLHIRIDDASIRAVEISGIFSAYDAEAFVRFLERQPEMRVERAGREIVVTAAPAAAP